MIIIILFFHESGHIFFARKYKWKIESVDILPFGGVAKVSEALNKPFHEEFLVTIGGPLQHLLLTAFSFICLPFDFWTESNHELFMTKNITILLFNLAPVWPLDGGKLLFLLISRFLPFKRAYQMTLAVSLGLVIIISLAVVISYPGFVNGFLVAGYLIVLITKDLRRRHYMYVRFLMDKLESPPSARCKTIRVSGDMSVRETAALLQKSYRHNFLLEDGSKGTLSENTLLKAYFVRRLRSAPLKELTP